MTATGKQTFLKELSNWLSNENLTSSDGRYTYRCLQENLSYRAEIIEEMKRLMHRLHEDARNRIRKAHASDHSLDPFEELPTPSISYFTIDEYPKGLNIETLKGYFGEIFAGIIAENLNSHSENWEVPAFLFRFHQSAFDKLEMMRQVGSDDRNIIGRHGDDCLAFQRDSNGKIVRSLVCEAKCTYTHQKSMIEDAHAKASAPNPVPISYYQLIEILKDYEKQNPDAAAWVEALRQLKLITKETPDYERCDMVSYVCGLPPVRESTVSIPKNSPHTKYTANRRLEAVETHLVDVEGLVEQIYEKNDDFILFKDDGTDFDSIWQKVLSNLRPNDTKNLFTQQCWLCNFTGQKALIGVRSLNYFKAILRSQDNLQDAFTRTSFFQPTENNDKIYLKFKHYVS